MKKNSVILLLTITFLFACKKNNSLSTNIDRFEAKIDGKNYIFNVSSAALVKDPSLNKKHLDISGVSTDGKNKVSFILSAHTSVGNGVEVKKYVLDAFPEDNPDTPNVDESELTDGYTSYSTLFGTNSWLTDVYKENGFFTVTACDEKNTVISGTFETTLTSYNDNPTIIKITEGKMNNIRYRVLN